MRRAFITAVCEAAERNPAVWLLTADLGYSVLEEFADRFPDRFVNVGVAEQNMAGIAAGLALSGKTVVVYSIVNFATLRCLEQIRNDICYHSADVKIASVGAGFAYGAQGYTHHGIEDLTVMAALPGIDILSPGDPVEAGLAARAMLERAGPCYLRLGKSGEPMVHATPPPFTRGAMIPVREGRDALVIATGGVLAEAVEAARRWSESGQEAAVWSAPWLRPFDADAVARAAVGFPLILTVEEAVATGGLGAATARVLAATGAPRARQMMAALAPEIGPASLAQATARARYGLDAAGLLARLQSFNAADTV